MVPVLNFSRLKIPRFPRFPRLALMAKKKFYAVLRGSAPGVYVSWEEAKRVGILDPSN